MKKEDFDDKVRDASKAMLKKKAPTKPDTQFVKGAMFAWELLMEAHDRIYYEERYRQDVQDREGKVDSWKESLISELAEMRAERDEMMADIRDVGRLLDKWDKQNNLYRESNPLYVHVKALDQTISVWRDKLGLSNTVNPDRIKESPKRDGDDNSKIASWMRGRKDND